MQILESWDPLNLPRGSVRAIVTLSLMTACWVQILRGETIRPEVAYLVLLVTGHYFGARSAQRNSDRRGPLFLPKGSVRTIILVGFGVVGYFLWDAGRLRFASEALQDQGVILLCLVFALIGGIFVRILADLFTAGQPTTPRRWFENLKSVVVILAAGTVLLTVFLGPEEALNSNASLVASPIIGFYFGSRH